MCHRHRPLTAALFGPMLAAAVLPREALAQQVPGTSLLDGVVVIGQRASLSTAQALRRDADGIVDAVIAEDILKLPDFSVSEALQRVTGVQVARDRGDGVNVAIRGLAQTETLLDGREVFTAGTGRTLDFSTVPAEMVSAIRVMKTGSADQIQGGLGGTIDLRTRRPFDFADGASVLSLRSVHADLAGRTEPQASMLLSRRGVAGSSGEWGLLVSLAYQRRAFREDQKSAGAPMLRSDLVPGQAVSVASSTSETTSIGHRDRLGGSAVLQWRPRANIEITAEIAHAELRTVQDSFQINASPGTGVVPGSVVLFPGTADVQHIAWTQAPMSILSFARDTVDRSRQAALSARWSSPRTALSADLSSTRSLDRLFFSGPTLAATAAQFTQDVSTTPPSTAVAGTPMLDPASYRFAGVAYRTRPFDGRLTALRLDLEHRPATAWVDIVGAGWRMSDRHAGNSPGLIFGDAPLNGPSAADMPGATLPNPYRDFLPGVAAQSLRDFLVANLALARDPQALRDSFGITTALPTSASPLSLWSIREQTQAAYLQARLQHPRRSLDGVVGLRVLRLRESASGSQTDPAGSGLLPLQQDVTTTDWLPSASARLGLGGGTQLRAAVSRTVTRPTFDQLSPSLSLVPNAINPALNQGSAGNPALRAIRANNLDLALEHYTDAHSSVLATLFAKNVDGFVTRVSQAERYGGVDYLVSRPQNTGKGRIRGAELAFQRFFDQLPGAWRGLGLQANLTYVDSHAASPLLGQDAPLAGLSRTSANLIGLYEHGPASARLAYNWRSRFLSDTVSVVGLGALPVYTSAYGWLDASFRWRVSERLSIAVEGSNLLRTLRHSYFGAATRPRDAWLNDRQFGVAATLRF
ncbi:MAG TPA: TonB-dependent receptor [Albitalea sp.]|nr:TonB-dependent receptor [Albitalea sp.]